MTKSIVDRIMRNWEEEMKIMYDPYNEYDYNFNHKMANIHPENSKYIPLAVSNSQKTKCGDRYVLAENINHGNIKRMTGHGVNTSKKSSTDNQCRTEDIDIDRENYIDTEVSKIEKEGEKRGLHLVLQNRDKCRLIVSDIIGPGTNKHIEMNFTKKDEIVHPGVLKAVDNADLIYIDSKKLTMSASRWDKLMKYKPGTIEKELKQDDGYAKATFKIDGDFAYPLINPISIVKKPSEAD